MYIAGIAIASGTNSDLPVPSPSPAGFWTFTAVAVDVAIHGKLGIGRRWETVGRWEKIGLR